MAQVLGRYRTPRRSAKGCRTTRRAARRETCGASWQKKLTLSGASRRTTELVDLSSKFFAREHRRRQRTEAAGSRHSDGQRNTTRSRPSALARWATRSRAGRSAHQRRTRPNSTRRHPGSEATVVHPCGMGTCGPSECLQPPRGVRKHSTGRKSVIAAAGSGRSPSRAAGAPSRRRDGTRRRTGQHRARRMPSVKADRTSRG